MAISSNEKVWIGGGGVGALLLIALAWMVVIHPEMSNAASLRTQTVSAQDQNTVLRIKTNKLRKESDQLPMLAGQLAVARAGLPDQSAMTAFTRQLNQQAKDSKLAITQLTVGVAKAVSAATATGGAATAPSTPVNQLYAVPVTVIVTGNAAEVQTFLQKVQYVGPRRALVTSLQMSPGAGAKTISIDSLASSTVQLTVFVAPQSSAAQAQLQKQLNAAVGSN